MLSQTEEGDAMTKGYVDSKSAGECDLDMGSHSIRNINPSPMHEED